MNSPATVSTEAVLDVTSLELRLDPSLLHAALERAWHGAASSTPSIVLLEWWRVRGGLVRFGDLDHSTVSRAIGAAMGGFATIFSPMSLATAEQSFEAGARNGAARAGRIADTLARSFSHYQELAVLVPGLHVQGCDEPVSYAAAMWTDSAFARTVDVGFGFGMNKRSCTFQHDPTADRVRDTRGIELLSAHFEPTDDSDAPTRWDSVVLGRLGNFGVLSRFERDRPAAHRSHAFTLQSRTGLGGVVPPGLHHGIARSWVDVPARLRTPHQRLPLSGAKVG